MEKLNQINGRMTTEQMVEALVRLYKLRDQLMQDIELLEMMVMYKYNKENPLPPPEEELPRKPLKERASEIFGFGDDDF